VTSVTARIARALSFYDAHAAAIASHQGSIFTKPLWIVIVEAGVLH
jgi:hypothetical protein